MIMSWIFCIAVMKSVAHGSIVMIFFGIGGYLKRTGMHGNFNFNSNPDLIRKNRIVTPSLWWRDYGNTWWSIEKFQPKATRYYFPSNSGPLPASLRRSRLETDTTTSLRNSQRTRKGLFVEIEDTIACFSFNSVAYFYRSVLLTCDLSLLSLFYAKHCVVLCIYPGQSVRSSHVLLFCRMSDQEDYPGGFRKTRLNSLGG